MKTINTQDLAIEDLTGTTKDLVYNGMDCCITSEVFDQILPQLDPQSEKIYDLERRLQAPAMEMALRGIRIDTFEASEFLSDLSARMKAIQSWIDRMGKEIWNHPINPHSTPQLIDLFYDQMNLPPQYRYDEGEMKVTCDRKALETLAQKFPIVNPLITAILAFREDRKLFSTLNENIDPDGRFRATFSPSGTETGRWSSRKNPYKTGDNLQNKPEALRRIFVADPGHQLAYIDFEQAESRIVGLTTGILFDDWTYLDACEGADLHTQVVRMIWPSLPWTGDPKTNRKIADEKYHRNYSRRDIAKRAGHGTNDGGSAFGIASEIQVESNVIDEFQQKYLRAFPAIKRWHEWIVREIQTKQKLTNVFGRQRWFFDRPSSHSTHKEGIAFIPQSGLCDYLNYAMLDIWNEMDEIHLLAQVHDALLLQYPIARERILIPKILELLSPTFEFSGREFRIPTEANVGHNWGKRGKKNPKGMTAFQV